MNKQYFGMVSDKIIKNVESIDDMKDVIGIVLFGANKPNPFNCSFALEEYKNGKWIYLFYGEAEDIGKDGTKIGKAKYITAYGLSITGGRLI